MYKRLLFLVCGVLVFSRLSYCEEPAASILSSSELLIFKLIPEESSAGFSAQSTLHDFSGVTNAIDGYLKIIPTDLENTAVSVVKVDPSKLTTGIKARDRWMKHDLEVTKYKEISWTLKNAKVRALDNQKGKLEITGTLDLHGVQKDITSTVDVEIKDNKVIIDGETPLLMSDYGIKPSSMLFLKVKDKVVLKYHLAGKLSAP